MALEWLLIDQLNKWEIDKQALLDILPVEIQKQVDFTKLNTQSALSRLQELWINIYDPRCEWGDIDLSKYPKFASLSWDKMGYYFDWNNVEIRTDYKPDISWKINHRKKISDIYKIEWNLQYLLWETTTITYMNLDNDHKELIKEMSDIILTDEYAKDIEDKRKWVDKKMDIVEWTKFKTIWFALYLKRVVNLCHDIEEVNSWVMKRYNWILSSVKNFETKKWYTMNKQAIELLSSLRWEIEAVLQIHKLLDEEIGRNSMDYKKKHDLLLKELEEKTEILKQLKTNNDKLEAFIKIANRFLDINGRY